MGRPSFRTRTPRTAGSGRPRAMAARCGVIVVTALDADLRAALPPTATACAGAIAALDPRCVLARSRTTECAIVELPGGTRVVRKRWTWPRARDRAKGALRTTVAARSPARREHDALLRLRALPSGPWAPRPLGVVEERGLGVLRTCTLLVEEVRGAADLATFLRDERNPSRRRAVLADLGRRTREMHDAGLRDGEHHPRNVLVLADAPRTLRIDCAKQRVSRRPVRGDLALRDLAALDVALARFGTEEERRTLVAGWLGAGAPAAEVSSALARVGALRRHLEPRESRRLPPPSTA